MKGKHELKQQIELFHLAEGFLASRILFTLVKLRVFEHLGPSALTANEIAERSGTAAEAVLRLLHGGVAVKLLETEGDAFRVASAWAPYLSSEEGARYLGHWFRFQDYWYTALAGLDTAVRDNRPTADYESALLDDRELTLAMHDHASLRGRELAGALDLSGCGTLLDVGCGPGSYAFEIGRENPGLELHLADRPAVLEIAREVASRYDAAERVHYQPLDLTHEEISGGYDVVLVSNALHVLGESESRRLLSRLCAAVNPGGSLVVQAQYLDDDRRGARWPVLLDLALLCTTPAGRNHTVAETRDWMAEAGFRKVEHRTLSVFNPNSYLRGYRD